MKILSLVVVFLLTGCLIQPQPKTLRVHQEHLDAWANMPLEALETHTWFLTRPLVKSKTSSGLDIWHYYDGHHKTSCSSHGDIQSNISTYLSSSQYQSWASCVGTKVGCNSIFFIKNKVILKYQVTGSCYTSKVLLPQNI